MGGQPTPDPDPAPSSSQLAFVTLSLTRSGQLVLRVYLVDSAAPDDGDVDDAGTDDGRRTV